MVLRLRDPVNGFIHFFGIPLSIAGLAALVMASVGPIRPYHLITFTVFGLALTGMYVCSTLYHWLPLSAHGVSRMRKLDHSMVFILIAATYTPICLIPMRGSWGWTLFGIIWGLALAGLVFKLFWLSAPRWLSTGIYVLMGWVVLVAVKPLVEMVEIGAIVWLVAGGVAYTVGALVYWLKRPDPLPGRFGFHEIFHVFCMLGSLCHFWVMYGYIVKAQ